MHYHFKISYSTPKSDLLTHQDIVAENPAEAMAILTKHLRISKHHIKKVAAFIPKDSSKYTLESFVGLFAKGYTPIEDIPEEFLKDLRSIIETTPVILSSGFHDQEVLVQLHSPFIYRGRYLYNNLEYVSAYDLPTILSKNLVRLVQTGGQFSIAIHHLSNDPILRLFPERYEAYRDLIQDQLKVELQNQTITEEEYENFMISLNRKSTFEIASYILDEYVKSKDPIEQIYEEYVQVYNFDEYDKKPTLRNIISYLKKLQFQLQVSCDITQEETEELQNLNILLDHWDQNNKS